MFSPDDKFSDRISESNTHDVAAASFVNYFADFAVESSMGQGFLLGRVYFDYDACACFVFVEELCELRFSFFSNRFPHETAGSRTISF